MRAVTSDYDDAIPGDSLLRVLDQFASLRSYSTVAPTVGGYRLLTSKRDATLRMAREVTSTATTVAALARARLRLSGFLSVLFVGALGLAVLAGPATCPTCGNDANTVDRPSLARLGYAGSAQLTAAREEIKGEAELPTLASTTLVEPEADASGVSPITTSALEAARNPPAATPDRPAATGAGRLPIAAVPLLTDAGPTIKLAAANIDADMLSRLPAIETTATPKTHIKARDVEVVAESKPSLQKKRFSRAYRTPVAKTAARHAPASGDAMAVKRAPKWAQQMYVTPWQSQAFSYTR